MRHLHLRGSAGLLIITLSMLLALVVAAPVAAKNPPGNNGTVKIDGVEWDSHPDNEPHVGCTFEVDFYGFDMGAEFMAEVTFEALSPTGMTLLLHDEIFIGPDAAGGGTDLDASREYDLTDELASYAIHPQQGYHVKLTVNADGSIGADTKHKVFWVTGCDPQSPLGPLGPPPPPPAPLPPPPGGGTEGNNPSRAGTLGSSGGTLGSSGGPAVMLLPDTALDGATASLALLAGMFLLGASTTTAAVTVRRDRSRRR